jgi:hypothetical protein
VTTVASSGQTQQAQQPAQSQSISFNPLLVNQQSQQQQQRQQQQQQQQQQQNAQGWDESPAPGGAQQWWDPAPASAVPQSWSRAGGADPTGARWGNPTAAHVVPEPAALVLAALGLPFLLLLRRRKPVPPLTAGGD